MSKCPTCPSTDPKERWFVGTTNKERNNYTWAPYPHGTGFIDVCPDEYHKIPDDFEPIPRRPEEESK